MSPRPGGYTLVEMVVACAVALLVLTSVARLMVAGGQLYLRGSTRADLQAAALVAVTTMDRGLREAAPTLTTVLAGGASEPPALACRAPVARQFLVVFLDRQRRTLVRKAWPRLAPDGSLADAETYRETAAISEGRGVSAAELRQICASVNGSERAMAGNVADFAVTLGAGTATLRLQLEKQVLDQTIADTAGTTILMRNKL